MRRQYENDTDQYQIVDDCRTAIDSYATRAEAVAKKADWESCTDAADYPYGKLTIVSPHTSVPRPFVASRR